LKAAGYIPEENGPVFSTTSETDVVAVEPDDGG
jgi:hypothetical protein